MLSAFHNREDNNYHILLVMSLLSKQVGYSPSLSFFLVMIFEQILNAVTTCN